MEYDSLKELSYKLNGLAMRVHRELGHGLLEILYKDALEVELREAGIPFEREKEFLVFYRGKPLRHKFYCDFIVCGEVILEVKSLSGFVDDHYHNSSTTWLFKM